VTNARTIRTFLVLLPLVLSAVAALSFAGSASAGMATKCGQQVLTDWYDNGRIDKLYPLNCYEEAIDEIPSDIGPYVDAEDVITRALQGAMSGKLGNGGCDPSADGSADDCSGTGGRNGGGSNGGSGGNDGGSGGQAQDVPDVNTSSPSSVPIPLLVLGGMSMLLLAAGALGYVSRRRQAAHADEFDDSGNPPV
jgi:uncharacterized membrane protein YgcG